jgi:hypothetical protein
MVTVLDAQQKETRKSAKEEELEQWGHRMAMHPNKMDVQLKEKSWKLKFPFFV